jgi:hypothetical protein
MDITYECLTDKNFLLYCAKFYDNPACHTVDEFLEDLKRIKYVKKAFSRYETTGEIKHRLVLNHVIILLNVFGPIALARILFFKMPEYLRYLKPFLLFLNVLPDRLFNIGKPGFNYVTDDIGMDMGIINKLREVSK